MRALNALLVILLAAPTPAQMVSAGAVARPGKPLPPGLKAPRVDFRDVAREAGLTAVNVSGDVKQKSYIVEDTGNGVALIDFDNDGLLDILFVTADRLESKAPHPTLHLYHNLGGLKFEDVTEKAGLGHTGWGQGVCAGDVDNDGYEDLFITQWGRNILYRNQGNGTFKDETRQRGLEATGRRWSTGCAFVDYDRDGHLDLFVANYVDFNPAATLKPTDPEHCVWRGLAVACGPRGLPGETMSLYRNDGHGQFTDVSNKAGVAGPRKYYGLTVLTGDFDNDGWPDVYVASDSTPSLLFHNKRNGTFEEIGVYSGAAYNEDGREQAGMGAAAADYDGDGFLDILKTNFSNDVPTLYHNNGNGTFTDVTTPAGLSLHTEFVQWGCAFVDVDNDGGKDIFIAAGHLYPEVDTLQGNETFRQPRLLYWNRRDGQFFDLSGNAGSGLPEKHSSRGLAVGDLDNDGSPEIVIVNMNEPPSLLKNFAEKGNALLVEAITASGRHAIGARIRVSAGGRKQFDEVRSGGYYISQGDFRVHFGLAAEARADVMVEWVGGKVEVLPGVAANQWITVREGNGLVKAVKLRTPAGGAARPLADPGR
jgi:hypothetical protein